MLRYFRLVAVGIGVLGFIGPAAAFHKYGQTQAVVGHQATVLQQPAYIQSTATVLQQPAYVQPTYVQPTYVQPTYVQPTYVQPTYVQPTYVQQPPATVLQQPAYVVQPVYVQQPAATGPQAATAAQPCPQQELRIRVFTEGGSGSGAAVRVQPATVTQEKVAAMLELARATKQALEAAQKTNDALIKALESK